MNARMKRSKSDTEVRPVVMQKPEEFLENRVSPSIGPSGRRGGQKFCLNRVIGFFLNFYKSYSSAYTLVCQSKSSIYGLNKINS